MPAKVKKRTAKRWSQEAIERLIDALETWSFKSDSYFLKDFITQHKPYLTHHTLDSFAKDDPVISEIITIVKTRILARLYKDAALKKMDGNFVGKLLPIIDPDYRSWRKEELQISDESLVKKFRLMIHPGRLPKAIDKEAKDGRNKQ